MRIGIVLNTSWNIYNFRSSLVRRLVTEGYEVFAIAPEDIYSKKLPELGCSYHPIKMDNTGSNPIKDLRLLFSLKRLYKSLKLDVVLQFTIKPNIYGTLAANSLGIKSINNVSGLGTVFLNKGITASIAQMLYKRSFQKADMVFFQNDDDRKDFIRHVNIPDLKYDLLPGSGINLTHFQPREKPISAPFRFLMIARLIIDKGALEYLEAAKKLKADYPEIQFQLVGQLDEGHSRGISKNIIDNAVVNKEVNYLGTTDDIRKLIGDADCVVLPSYREGTPRTLLEAAAMARPIITTDVPGCREVVKHESNGLLCEARNSEDLANCMRKMILCDLQTREKMGKAGRRLVEEQFDEELVIKKYLKYICQYSG